MAVFVRPPSRTCGLQHALGLVGHFVGVWQRLEGRAAQDDISDNSIVHLEQMLHILQHRRGCCKVELPHEGLRISSRAASIGKGATLSIDHSEGGASIQGMKDSRYKTPPSP